MPNWTVMRARGLVLLLGVFTALAAAILAGLSSVPVWVAPILLGGCALGLGAAVVALERARVQARDARRIKRWPWMAQAQRLRPPQAAFPLMSQAGYPRFLVDGPSVQMDVPAGRWSWTPIYWRQGTDDDEAPEAQSGPRVEAWIIQVAVDAAHRLPWGNVRQSRALVMPWRAHHSDRVWKEGHLEISGQDGVDIRRSWTPVALERLQELPRAPVFGIESNGREAVVIVPVAWMDGADMAPLLLLLSALQAATPAELWEALRADLWRPCW